jgi:hypothetical protein
MMMVMMMMMISKWFLLCLGDVLKNTRCDIIHLRQKLVVYHLEMLNFIWLKPRMFDGKPTKLSGSTDDIASDLSLAIA